MSSRNDKTVAYPVAGGGQSVAYTATAGTVANPISADIRMVMVWASTDAHVTMDGTATTSDTIIPANTPFYFTCRPGQQPSAVQVSTGGNLYVSEMTW